MTLSQAGPLLGLGLLWLVSLLTTTTRNRRYLTCLGVVSVAVLVPALTLRGNPRIFIQLGAMAIGLAIWLWPTQFHLGSFEPADYAAYATMHRFFAASKGPGNEQQIQDLLPELETGAFAVPASPWANTATLVRLYAARSMEPELGSPEPGTSPAWAYRTAAIDYWRYAYWRRVLGRDRPPSQRDEDILLRAYSETFHRLMPKSAFFEEPGLAIDGWEARADEFIEEVRALRLVDPGSEDMRRLLLESMNAQLALARGDRTEVARARQTAAATALFEGWRDEGALVVRGQD